MQDIITFIWKTVWDTGGNIRLACETGVRDSGQRQLTFSKPNPCAAPRNSDRASRSEKNVDTESGWI